MTMLMRWLFLAAVILGPWMAVLTNRYQSPWVDQNRHTLLLYPFALIAAFGTEQEALERCTRRDREAWFAARRGRITASVFQRVSNMRPTTPCDSVLEVLLYGAGRELDTPALRYGRQNEERAIREYERRTGVLVRHPLAAAGGSFCLDRAMKLRRGHPYYGQVQAQMACCGARFCDFFVWTPHESECDRIAFDPDFWQQKIGPVREFFLECLLPEMVDPRKARGLPYRERRKYRPRRH
ncbi:hypothetical protein FJT64_018847 [Amphibalanus amphitrite]|uniref:YqaJ viral recombinase domain-containing protein n=1 Tax=Amphibalanus amphitrite TaxID=1232801 RepID=A0A6A4WRJ7_AMPAM|nr:hypothetical protein FJT64_018847 [Amphibalanus amphitrite]KAF0310097.1 hypothetical protein FJT64_018847 [Amphibalanus amphitrite]